MFLHIATLSIIYTRIILSCDVHVCLTWMAKRENITFKCKVSQLKWRVYFINPLNKEEGHCLSPIPISTCYSHNVIYQDRKTNTTLLVIQREVDSRLDGSWKCIHGTRRDAAIVNVTVIHKVTIKTVSDTDNCYEEYMAWTLVSVMICLIILLVVRIVLKVSSDTKYCSNNMCKREVVCKGRCLFRSKLQYVIIKSGTGILFILVVIFVPLFAGEWIFNCKYKHLFALFGCFIVFLFGICCSIPKKGKALPNDAGDSKDEVEMSMLKINGDNYIIEELD